MNCRLLWALLLLWIGPGAAQEIAPRFLHDEAEVARFVEEGLPQPPYQVFDVPWMGRFYLEPDRVDNIKSQLRAGHLWEPHNRELLKRYVRFGSVMLDLGAHIGTHAILASRLVGPQGRVYAFEPQKKIYRELVWNLRLNGLTNVIPLRFAVGASNGVVRMDVPPATNEGGTAVGSGGDPVELRTLDSFGFRDVSVLKLDVEGFEDQVLEGARATLAREKPVLLLEIQGGYDHATAPEGICRKILATVSRLNALGYRVSHVPSPEFGNHDFLALPDAQARPRGVTIDFGLPWARLYERSGFYPGESYAHGSFTFLRGSRGELSFWLERPHGEYVLRLRALRVLSLPRVTSRVLVNGRLAGTLTWEAGEFTTQELVLRAGLLREGENQLVLECDGSARLAAQDPREGALCLDLLWLEPRP